MQGAFRFAKEGGKSNGQCTSCVRRKETGFCRKGKRIKHEVKHYLGIAADQVRVLIRYDVENVSDATYQKALQTVFSEPPVMIFMRRTLTQKAETYFL